MKKNNEPVEQSEIWRSFLKPYLGKIDELCYRAEKVDGIRFILNMKHTYITFEDVKVLPRSDRNYFGKRWNIFKIKALPNQTISMCLFMRFIPLVQLQIYCFRRIPMASYIEEIKELKPGDERFAQKLFSTQMSQLWLQKQRLAMSRH